MGEFALADASGIELFTGKPPKREAK
jgi:hypothetical protein